ncbi:MAG: hypothetical protein EBT03_09965 [Betaproteobacteria bacterium]|nr:hypothetical protein [Betaproteobacteria bacterium]
MNDIQKIALSKVKFDRDAVPSGEHRVDFMVRVSGVVKVGEDYEKSATTSVPWLESVALWQETLRAAFDSMIEQVDRGQPITREELEAMKSTGPIATGILVDCIRQAMVAGESAVGKIEARVEEVKAGIEKVKADLVSELPLQTAKGHVKVSVVLEELVTAREVAAAVAPSVPVAV